MKSYIRFFVFMVALCAGWIANAQINRTVFYTGFNSDKWRSIYDTTDLLGSGDCDSRASALRDIGFVFPFGNQEYTMFSVNSDGNLRLGSTVTGTGAYVAPFSGSNVSANSPKINFFGCDGYHVDSIHYVRAERRWFVEHDYTGWVMVVEFCLGTFATSTRTQMYKWQVHLYGNGNIEVVYPSTVPAQAPAVTHQQGFCFPSGTGWIVNSSNEGSSFGADGTDVHWPSGTWPEANRYYEFKRCYDYVISPTSTWQTHTDSTNYDADHVKLYAVNMYPGYRYTFKTGCGDGATADFNTLLKLYDLHGVQYGLSDDDCESNRSILICSPIYQKTLYLEVRGGTGGHYTLAYRRQECQDLDIPDYHHEIFPTTSWQTHDGNVIPENGCNHTRFIYRLNVDSGYVYTFKTGCGDGATADFNSELELYDTNGDLLADDFNSCGDGGSQIDYIATTSGYFFLVVKSRWNSSTGSYTLAYKKECLDIPNYHYEINPFSCYWKTHSGNTVNTCANKRIYRVRVEAGRLYNFQTGCGGGATADFDTYLEVFDSSGTRLAYNDDYTGCGTGLSQVQYVPTQSGYVFLVVRGFGNSTGNYTLAYRVLSPVTITVVASPTEGGTVSGGGTFYEFDVCTVTATPAAGYAFVNWTHNGMVFSNNATCFFEVSTYMNRRLTANFVRVYDITATADPTAGGIVTGAGTYTDGSTCKLTATQAVGYKFISWTEGGTVVSTDPIYTFTVSSGRTLTANFAAVPCGIAAADLPYTEDFESYTTSTTAETGMQPSCWEVIQEDVALTTATRPQLYYNTTYATSGSYTLRMKNRCVYAMHELDDNINVQNLTMTFNLRQPKAVYRLQVGVVNANGVFEAVKTINNASTDTEEITVDFANYSGSGHRIAFRNTLGGGSTLDYSINYLDDIVIGYTAAPCGISELPYSENFDTYTAVTTAETGVQPDCWEVTQEDVALTNATKPQVYYNATYATSGSYTLRMKNRCVYAMPRLSGNVNIQNLTMTFNLRQPKAVYRLQVGVVNDNGVFELVKTVNNASTGTEPITVDFANYAGSGRRIAFRNTLASGSTLDYSINYIDDITLDYTPDPCDIVALPYTENFDGFTTSTTAETGIQPDCWEVITEDVALTNATKPQVYYNASYATSGSYTLRMKNRCVYAMPRLTGNVNIQNLTMTFNLRQPKAVYRLQVGVVNDNGVFELVKTINNASTGMEPITVDFANYAGSGHRIAFRNTLSSGSTLDYSVNYIDNIELDYSSSCGIRVLPYAENFDGYTSSTTAETGVQPDCWEVFQEDVALTNATKPQVYYNTTYATSGSYTLRMKNRCVYAMPELSGNINIQNLTMTFSLRQPKAVYRLQVGVVNDNGVFELVKTVNNSSTNMEDVTVNFSNYNGNGRRIAFRNTLGSGSTLDYSVNYIDDINISRTTKSMAVTDANADNSGMLGAERDMLDITVYPNPTKDVVNVECTMNNVQCSGIEVIDVYGKVVRNVVETFHETSLPTQINVSGLAAGMYFVRVTTDRGVVTRPFVKR